MVWCCRRHRRRNAQQQQHGTQHPIQRSITTSAYVWLCVYCIRMHEKRLYPASQPARTMYTRRRRRCRRCISECVCIVQACRIYIYLVARACCALARAPVWEVNSNDDDDDKTGPTFVAQPVYYEAAIIVQVPRLSLRCAASRHSLQRCCSATLVCCARNVRSSWRQSVRACARARPPRRRLRPHIAALLACLCVFELCA